MWSRAGHDVMVSSRHPEGTEHRIQPYSVDIQVGFPEDAAAYADVILEAVPYAHALEFDPDLFDGKLLISASNYYPQRDGKVEFDQMTQTGLLADRYRSATVAKAFNMMAAEHFLSRVQGNNTPEKTVFIAGDESACRETVEPLVRDAQFSAVNAGDLTASILFQPGTELYGNCMPQDEAQDVLETLKAQRNL